VKEQVAMLSIGLAGMMVGIVIAQIPALRRQWLEDRAGAIKSWRLLAYYFLYLIVGVVALIAPMRRGGAPEYVALAAVVFFLGWLLLGVSWLIKLIPKYKPVAAWLLRPVGPSSRICCSRARCRCCSSTRRRSGAVTNLIPACAHAFTLFVLDPPTPRGAGGKR
jgi:hypothetical protein